MCGRYHLTRDPLGGVRSSIPETMPGPRDPFEPRYNIDPIRATGAGDQQAHDAPLG